MFIGKHPRLFLYKKQTLELAQNVFLCFMLMLIAILDKLTSLTQCAHYLESLPMTATVTENNTIYIIS